MKSAPEHRKRVRCAIYTRKSSEEGLEQAFNSLDAQREACAAYIASQRHEGWQAIETHYDDGGYSGGTMERPALRALLGDIGAGKIDTVVVYKVDRLTRALADFAKIIELFDANGVSFVSVTQQFNTTTSMGRLTLNVLLSFAQFEREVTGERIRDKIAASKKKGMWMGGRLPLGYDRKDRQLVVNSREADLVRMIFKRYLALGCVRKLRNELAAKGIKSKCRVSPDGRKAGGALYSRGALYNILRNRLYVGEIFHKGHAYQGEHQAIVPKNVWDAVQAQLETNGQARRTGVQAREPSLLAGLLRDDRGNRYTPSHTVKSGKRYRYYVSQAAIQDQPGRGTRHERIPAQEIENLVSTRIRAFLSSSREVLDAASGTSVDPESLAPLISWAKTLASRWDRLSTAEKRRFFQQSSSEIVVSREAVTTRLLRSKLRLAVLGPSVKAAMHPKGAETRPPSGSSSEDFISLEVPAKVTRHGMEVRIVVPGRQSDILTGMPSTALVRAVARGHYWYDALGSGEVASLQALARTVKLNERYVGRLLHCAFLAPSVVAGLLEGKLSVRLTLERILKGIPLGWDKQREMFDTSYLQDRRI